MPTVNKTRKSSSKNKKSRNYLRRNKNKNKSKSKNTYKNSRSRGHPRRHKSKNTRSRGHLRPEIKSKKLNNPNVKVYKQMSSSYSSFTDINGKKKSMSLSEHLEETPRYIRGFIDRNGDVTEFFKAK